MGYCVPCQHRHDVCCNVHAHNTSHKAHCIAGHLLCAAFAVAARFRVNCAVEISSFLDYSPPLLMHQTHLDALRRCRALMHLHHRTASLSIRCAVVARVVFAAVCVVATATHNVFLRNMKNVCKPYTGGTSMMPANPPLKKARPARCCWGRLCVAKSSLVSFFLGLLRM